LRSRIEGESLHCPVHPFGITKETEADISSCKKEQQREKEEVMPPEKSSRALPFDQARDQIQRLISLRYSLPEILTLS
jgi:hypothetical protein